MIAKILTVLIILALIVVLIVIFGEGRIRQVIESRFKFIDILRKHRTKINLGLTMRVTNMKTGLYEIVNVETTRRFYRIGRKEEGDDITTMPDFNFDGKHRFDDRQTIVNEDYRRVSRNQAVIYKKDNKLYFESKNEDNLCKDYEKKTDIIRVHIKEGLTVDIGQIYMLEFSYDPNRFYREVGQMM